MNVKANALKVLNLIKIRGWGTSDAIASSLGMSIEDVKKALEYNMWKGYINLSEEGVASYVGRFVRFNFSTGGETRADPVSRTEVLSGSDAPLGAEEITLTNIADEEEFVVTFNITGIESAELARRFSFVVDEETDKEVTKLYNEGSTSLRRPILEKKAIAFDRLLSGQTKKYYWNFVVDREFIEKLPKNKLTCTLKINCLSLNYHDFTEMSIRLEPGWV